MKIIIRWWFLSRQSIAISRQTSKLSKLFVLISDYEICIHAWIRGNRISNISCDRIVSKSLSTLSGRFLQQQSIKCQKMWKEQAEQNKNKIERIKWYEGCHAQFRNLCILRGKCVFIIWTHSFLQLNVQHHQYQSILWYPLADYKNRCLFSKDGCFHSFILLSVIWLSAAKGTFTSAQSNQCRKKLILSDKLTFFLQMKSKE